MRRCFEMNLDRFAVWTGYFLGLVSVTDRKSVV